MQQWAACLVGMKCRDDAHQTVREALRYAPPPPHPRGTPGGAPTARGRAVIGPGWARLVPGEQAPGDKGGTCSPASALKAPLLFTKISAFLKSFQTSPGPRAAGFPAQISWED